MLEAALVLRIWHGALQAVTTMENSPLFSAYKSSFTSAEGSKILGPACLRRGLWLMIVMVNHSFQTRRNIPCGASVQQQRTKSHLFVLSLARAYTKLRTFQVD